MKFVALFHGASFTSTRIAFGSFFLASGGFLFCWEGCLIVIEAKATDLESGTTCEMLC